MSKENQNLNLSLKTRIQKSLADSPYYAVRHVVCDVSDGVPVLRGRVPTYFMKQMALSTVLAVLGDSEPIKNGLEVTGGP